MITEKSDTCCAGHLNKQKVGNRTYMYRCMKRNGDLQRGTFSCSLVLLVLDIKCGIHVYSLNTARH